MQAAPVVASNQFAILDAALLSDLGGQQFSALLTPAGVPSNSFFRVVAFPPNASNGSVITAQPQNQTVLIGATANFSVTASGASLRYRWRKNGADISGVGATTTAFTIPATTLADAGNYSARVWNNNGELTSTNATLAVVNGLLPQIIVPPFDRVAPTNTSVAFNVLASGTPAPLFQWYFNGAPVGWADAEPNPRTNGSGAFNAATGNYGNRRFSVAPLLGDVWILYTFKMETPADSYYTTSLATRRAACSGSTPASIRPSRRTGCTAAACSPPFRTRSFRPSSTKSPAPRAAPRINSGPEPASE